MMEAMKTMTVLPNLMRTISNMPILAMAVSIPVTYKVFKEIYIRRNS